MKRDKMKLCSAGYYRIATSATVLGNLERSRLSTPRRSLMFKANSKTITNHNLASEQLLTLLNKLAHKSIVKMSTFANNLLEVKCPSIETVRRCL